MLLVLLSFYCVSKIIFTNIIVIILSNILCLKLNIFLDKDTLFNIVDNTFTDNTFYHYNNDILY